MAKKTKRKVTKKKPVKKVVNKKTTKRKPVKRVVKKRTTPKISKGIAYVGLLLNILIIPGLGSIVGRRNKVGALQLILSIIGIILTMTGTGAITGIPVYLATWIWGILTGVSMLQEAYS